MPLNPAPNLNQYKIHFLSGSPLTIKTPEKFIKILGKPDKGGHHPVVTIDDDYMINLDNITYVENKTPEEQE